MDNGSLKVSQGKWQTSSRRLKAVPRSHEESKPRNCIRQAHACYLCGPLQAGESQRLIFTAAREVWHTSIERWVSPSLPRTRHCAGRLGTTIKCKRRTEAGKYWGKEIQTEKGDKPLHCGQARYRMKWNGIRENCHFHCERSRHWQHSGTAQLGKTSHIKRSPSYPPLGGSEPVQFRGISVCRAKAWEVLFINSCGVQTP